jgi:hypothetical protein
LSDLTLAEASLSVLSRKRASLSDLTLAEASLSVRIDGASSISTIDAHSSIGPYIVDSSIVADIARSSTPDILADLAILSILVVALSSVCLSTAYLPIDVISLAVLTVGVA